MLLIKITRKNPKGKWSVIINIHTINLINKYGKYLLPNKHLNSAKLLK